MTFVSGLYAADIHKTNDAYALEEGDNSVSLYSYRRMDGFDPENAMKDIAISDTSDSMNELRIETPILPNAVEITSLSHTYGSGIKAVPVLRQIDLHVPSGQIYGLLGPSGCGKTTLLRCLVGRLKPSSGSIKVLGCTPGSFGAPVPGPMIGYMPQELALFPDFAINETLVFFGRIFGMKLSNIRERVKFLVSFLDLPEKSRLVGQLSGGQKRRVSLAVALINSPPLLILDEPTVGVDPVLRQTIWNYLVTLTQETGITVIITTHYIEEARAARTVGMMRSGRMLCESSPDGLMDHFKMATLESVFLRLCEMDSELNGAGTPNRSIKKLNIDFPETKSLPHINILNETPVKSGRKETVLTADKKGKILNNNEVLAKGDLLEVVEVHDLSNEKAEQTTKKRRFGFKTKSKAQELAAYDAKKFETNSWQKTSALFKKNLIRLRRNLPVLCFQFLLPSIEVILFCICIGQDPFGIPVAVFNEEPHSSYGNLFLQSIDNSTCVMKNYESRQSAVDAVYRGDAWGAILIRKNFSQALQMRVIMGGGVDNYTVASSNIDVRLDMTNQIIAYELQRTLLRAWLSFSNTMSSKMAQNPAAFEFPIKFDAPVYGVKSPSFTEFMAPGVLLSIAFLAAVALTALAFVMERKEGLLERSLVAGVSSYEFLFSHVLTQLLVLLVQITLLLMFTFWVFRIPFAGPFIWVILLTLLQGACGMAYGLMISAICKEENSATMLALGSFYPNLLLSGTVWPIQAMPDFMRYFSYVLPQTIPIEAMRFILSRGWGPEHWEVGVGFVITIIWTTFFLVSAVVIFKVKK